MEALCWRTEYMAGKNVSVANVDKSKPPITARARGAVWLPPSLTPSAIGSMPQIIALAVMRIARKRLVAPSWAASRDARCPSNRLRSANDSNRIEFAIAIPIAMIAPMNDWTFSVVRVISSMSSTPHNTAGVVKITANERWKD